MFSLTKIEEPTAITLDAEGKADNNTKEQVGSFLPNLFSLEGGLFLIFLLILRPVANRRAFPEVRLNRWAYTNYSTRRSIWEVYRRSINTKKARILQPGWTTPTTIGSGKAAVSPEGLSGAQAKESSSTESIAAKRNIGNHLMLFLRFLFLSAHNRSNRPRSNGLDH